MTVLELLEGRKGGVVTVAASAPLAEAADLLVSHRIGALLVTDDAGAVTGIVSERDLARAIVEFGGGLFERRVEDVMTRPVVTCTPRDSMVEVLYLMNTNRIRHIPILDDDALVGIISVRDVTGKWLELLEHENRQLRDEVGGNIRWSA